MATTPTLRLALKFVLLTGVRKGEFIEATWDEVDFDAARWTIPAARMKAGKAHVVPLSEQAIDILATFRTCFSASQYLHPGRYDHDVPISNATLNRVIDAAVERIRKDDGEFDTFGVHDLRRTFSTGLNRAKFGASAFDGTLDGMTKAVINSRSASARFATECRASETN